MRLVVVLGAEMHIVGGDQRQVERVGKLYRRFFFLRAPAIAMAHQLDIKAARKQPGEALQQLARKLCPALCKRAADRAARSAAQRNHALRAAFETAPLDMRRFRSGRFQEGSGDELEQIAVAGFVLRQQQDRRRLVVVSCAPPGLVADRQQCTDDRLNAGLRGIDGELHRAEEIATVGDCNRRHAGLPAKRNQVLDPYRPFRQRVGGMHSEMHEIGMRHRVRTP